MTFLVLLFLLGGLMFIFSAVEHQPLKQFLQSWIGGGKQNG